ncbi:recombinase XerD (plasmid) [Cupriavidus necator]|uniref:Recombinase XerD n=1 Tax=Cupriavidus necator TaxID=106590 RepID=A0A367P8W7_CUPNE|nr:phage integrase family protein [Cupriavidus necator]QQX89416.1 recombinase XerD [Cupriavidus necator]RCJ03943.1 recombinase XerD [Cupriavidus necator]
MAQDPNTHAVTKLTRTEFAVVRAYAQGMRPVDIANRYLLDPDEDEHLSEAQAIQRILGLRDRLVQFALQHGQPEIASMFEALRARSDVGMSRRVDAVSALEQLGQSYPQPQHEVSLWFKPSLARRLMAANIRRIQDLTSLANRRGSSWWRTVPRIGAQSAEVITHWLVRQRSAMGAAAVKAYVLPPAAHARRDALVPLALAPGMPYPVPLEHMLAPAPNTAAGPGLAADLAFVRAWLHDRAPHTRNSYRREAERLLLWNAARKKGLQALEVGDLEAYEDFLADPQPAAFWCGPSGARDRMHWRPFEGPLRPSSVAAALRVVRALLRAMVKAGHLASAPLIPRQTAAAAATAQSAPSVQPDVEAFLVWLGEARQGPRHRAALAAVQLVRSVGLPLSELAALRCASLQSSANGTFLRRPGSRQQVMALHTAARQALEAHWADRGWPSVMPPAQAALLAPTVQPATTRGRNKRLEGIAAGYSASGLDQLLRSLWRHFCEQRGEPSEGFTPGQLRTRASRA